VANLAEKLHMNQAWLERQTSSLTHVPDHQGTENIETAYFSEREGRKATGLKPNNRWSCNNGQRWVKVAGLPKRLQAISGLVFIFAPAKFVSAKKILVRIGA